jgi:hypothetical protein
MLKESLAEAVGGSNFFCDGTAPQQRSTGYTVRR